MKLSEVIKIGMKRTGYASGVYVYNRDKRLHACALGAMYIGHMYGENDPIRGEDDLEDGDIEKVLEEYGIEWYDTFHSIGARLPQGAHPNATVSSWIMETSDGHGRDTVIKYLESVGL